MKYSLSLLFMFITIMGLSQIKTTPSMKFDATLKTKYELATETGMSRFSVRNSRVGLFGDLNEYVSYKFQIELSNEGKFDVLDLYGTIKPIKNLELSLGQLSIPIFNSYMITPSQMMFANRAFHAKYFAPGTRDIGALVAYNTKLIGIPVKFETGVFNANLINKPEWTKQVSYSARVSLGSMDGFRSTAKVYRYPGHDTTDILIWGLDFRYGKERYKVEAEIMNRHNFRTPDDLFSASLQAARSYPIKKSKIFKDITPAIRWDGIGHNFADRGFDINRLTTGFAFGFTTKPFSSLLRIDYEHYFIRDHIKELSKSAEMESSKITLELLLVF